MVNLPPEYRDLILFTAVPGLYLALVFLGRMLKRRHGVKLNWTYHLFSFCFALYFVAKVFNSHLTVKFPDDTEMGFRREVGAVVCLLGAFFVIALVNRYIWELYFAETHRVKVPKFLSEVTTLLIIATSVIVILELGYHMKIQGLLLGPGVLAVIVGLAMQDLFGNIIAGLALQFGKSFKDGDWLYIDNKYARVIETNWRTTRLLTIDDISIDVPNRDLSKQVITNLNLPTQTHAMRITVNIEYNAPPTRVKDILLHATANAHGVAPTPRPSVYLKNFGEFAVEYEIKFFADHHEHYYEVCDAIRTNIWYSLHRNGVKIPYPIQTVQLERPVRDKQHDIQNASRIMLRQHPLFKSLSDDQLDSLMPRGRVIHFGRGENVILQGEEGESMFILVSGEANVVVERNGHPTHVASLRSGDCFGEMSLLTGERRSATVLANKDCEVVEIGKSVLSRSLKENPELLAKLSALLAARQMETEGIVAANAKPDVVQATQTKYANTFTSRLRVFFEL